MDIWSLCSLVRGRVVVCQTSGRSSRCLAGEGAKGCINMLTWNDIWPSGAWPSMTVQSSLHHICSSECCITDTRPQLRRGDVVISAVPPTPAPASHHHTQLQHALTGAPSPGVCLSTTNAHHTPAALVSRSEDVSPDSPSTAIAVYKSRRGNLLVFGVFTKYPESRPGHVRLQTHPTWQSHAPT